MQQGNTILFDEGMALIRSGQLFDIEYVEANRQKGTGGRLVALSRVIISTAASGYEKKETTVGAAEPKAKKNPHHYANSTINIYCQSEKDRRARIKTVHVRLITRINGKDVI